MKVVSALFTLVIVTTLTVSIDLLAYQMNFSCGVGDSVSSPGPLTDLHYPADTVRALALWTTGDSAAMHCELWMPASYEMPPWANGLWDSTNLNSVTKFWLDNSNHKHLITADNRGQPDGRLILVGCRPAPYFDSTYCAAALDSADPYVDFSQYDFDGNGAVDLLILYFYCVGGTGTHVNSLQYVRDGVHIDDIISIEIGQGDPNPVLGLTCHEYGHTVASPGPRHETPIDLGGIGGSYGLGDFEIMARGGFANADNTDSRPSLWNPMLATGRFWYDDVSASQTYATEVPILTTQFNFPLRDYATEKLAYRLNRNPMSPDSQFFYVTAHHKRSRWEVYYPSTGLIIWHGDRGSNGMLGEGTINQRGVPKRLDIEAAGGMWDWTLESTVVRDTFLVWGSDPAVCTEHKYEVADVWTNGGTGNPPAGFDSLEVNWVRQLGQPFRPTYEPGHIGSAQTFFRTGSAFGPTTNPSSDFYAADSLQTVNTGIQVNVISIDSAAGITTADLIVNRWAGTIPRNYTWRDTINVVGNLNIGTDATLTILPRIFLTMQ
jgi:M6 family metalloprotease-like protein